MIGRRTLVLGSAIKLISLTASVRAQPAAVAEEQALRQVLPQYERAWNRHDVSAWSNLLTDDI
jgi:hypothetical protein